MTGLLRERLGFRGVAVSDDLEMKAIADPAAAAVEAVRAGVDVLLVCHHPAVQHRVLDALVDATRKGHISDQRLREAHARIDRLVQRFVRPAEDRVSELGSVEHDRLVEELALGYRGAAGRRARPHRPARRPGLTRRSVFRRPPCQGAARFRALACAWSAHGRSSSRRVQVGPRRCSEVPCRRLPHPGAGVGAHAGITRAARARTAHATIRGQAAAEPVLCAGPAL